MKYLLCLLCLLPTSCVATTGDLADLSAQLAVSLQALDDEVQEVDGDTAAALEKALTDMGLAVDGTIEVIEGRVADVVAGVTELTTKAAEGPAGWIELIAAMSGAVAAGGLALNHHRNGTRSKDIQASKA